MAEQTKKTEIIGVRVTPEVREKLEKRAKKGFRTLSQEVEMILSKAIGSKKG